MRPPLASRVLSLVILGFSLVPGFDHAFAQPPAAATTGGPLERAAEAVRAKRYREALTLYEGVLAGRPDNQDALRGASLCLLRMRRFHQVVPRLLQALALHPDDPAFRFDLAMALEESGRFGEAIVHWRQIESQASTDEKVAGLAEIPYHRGVCAKELALVPEAEAAFGQALRVANPASPLAEAIHEELGGLLLDAGRYAESAREFQFLVTRAPTQFRHHYHLGSAWLDAGSNDELAEKHLREARRLDPRAVEPSLRLGKLYLRQKKLDLAHALYLEASERAPRLVEPWHALQQIAALRGLSDEAQELQKKSERARAEKEALDEKRRGLERSVAVDPKNAAAWFELSELAIQDGALPMARKYLVRLLAGTPHHELALLNLSSLLAQNGRTEDALWELDKILERDPAHPFASLDAARHHLALGNAKEAAAVVVRGLDRFDAADDRFGFALDLLGEATQRARTPADAIEALATGFRRLPATSPARPRVALRHAQACATARKPLSALEILEAALAGPGIDATTKTQLLKTLGDLAAAGGDEMRAKRYREELDALDRKEPR